jgi:hypothetical protein
LKKILSLDANTMINVIKQLPDGAKEAIKTLAVQGIDNGSLNDIRNIRALDQYFGTDMLLKLVN